LKVLNNIYGQKQAGRVWYQYMTNILKTKLKYVQSSFDPCVLLKEGFLIVIYTDDTIIMGPSSDVIDRLIADIGQEFNITSEDSVNNFWA
jgi:Reverse transcriptase (RNA-dependent DNA polymerase)